MTLVNGWYSFNNIEYPIDTDCAKIILLNEYEFIVVPEIYPSCWYEHKSVLFLVKLPHYVKLPPYFQILTC